MSVTHNPKLTDGGEETMILKPKRNPGVRCSAVLDYFGQLSRLCL